MDQKEISRLEMKLHECGEEIERLNHALDEILQANLKLSEQNASLLLKLSGKKTHPAFYFFAAWFVVDVVWDVWRYFAA